MFPNGSIKMVGTDSDQPILVDFVRSWQSRILL